MKYFVIILLFLLFPFNLIAQEQGTIIPMEKGDKAPFDGILLDMQAAATILADTDAKFQKERVECDYEKAVSKANCDLLVNTLQISLDYERKQHIQTIMMYDSQLKSMEELATQIPEDDDDLMWAVIGMSGGVILTSIVFGVIMGVIQ